MPHAAGPVLRVARHTRSSRGAAIDCSPRRKPCLSSVENRASPRGATRMAHTCTRLLVHVVCSTRDRVPQIDAELRPQLFAYMAGIIREIGGTPVIINGPADHVHSLVGIPASLS